MSAVEGLFIFSTPTFGLNHMFHVKHRLI